MHVDRRQLNGGFANRRQGPLALLGACLALFLLTMPLWVDRAHGDALPDHEVSLVVTGAVGAQAGRDGASSSPSSVHCAIHCAPQVLFPGLLLWAILVPLRAHVLATAGQFHLRLNGPPLLPPPQTR